MRTLHLVALLPLSLAACGDGSFGTGIPPETVLDEADAEQLGDLCVAISNELLALATGPIQRTLCTSLGIGLDSAAVSCQEVRGDCLDEAEPPVVTSCDTVDVNAFDACDTTAGELEDCMHELRANIQLGESQISCGLTRSELAAIDTDNLFPARCTALGEECPALGMLLNFDIDMTE